MNSGERRARVIFHIGNSVVALAVSACLLAILGLGVGNVPALGRVLVPGHGAWRSAAEARKLVAESVTLAGLAAPSGAVSWEMRP